MNITDILVVVGNVAVYLLTGLLAALLARLTSRTWFSGNDKETYRYLMPILGPVGLCITLMVYLFGYLPSKLVKD